MGRPIMVLPLAAIALAGCTETLVVDATGEKIPNTEVYQTRLAGSSNVADPAADARGRTVRLTTGTTVNTFHFLDNNEFRIEDEQGQRMIRGTYFGQGDSICVRWDPRGQECWPRDPLLVSNQSQQITSDRGQTVTITPL